MADHMNVFEAFTSRPSHHEDALTRAFLVVLRGVPLAHSAWLQLVDRAHRAAGGGGVPLLHELAAPTVRTQTAAVSEHVLRVISLVQTDEGYFRVEDASRSERRQVLDGVVTYDRALAIVLENKPRRGDIWEGQLDLNLPDGVELDKKTACVTWKEIVLAWGGLLGAGHLGQAEVVLLGDFLDFVEAHFGQLLPYSKVHLCGTDVERLGGRCRMLLHSIAGEQHVEHHRSWGWFVRLAGGQSASQIGMMPLQQMDGLRLVVEIDPGDTMTQARTLYGQCEMDEVLALREHGWTIEPNLHLAHMNVGFPRMHTTLPVADFWRRWAEKPESIKQCARVSFEEEFAAYLQAGLVTAEDRAAFDEKLVRTERQTFNVCPGLTLRWPLRLDEAADLDQRGQLEAETRRAIQRAAAALKLKLPYGS